NGLLRSATLLNLVVISLPNWGGAFARPCRRCAHMSHSARSFLCRIAVLCMIVAASFGAFAQTQASCQFTNFNRRFSVNNGTRVLVPRGVNDYSTAVGDAQDDIHFSVRAYTRSSAGAIASSTHTSNVPAAESPA